MSTGNGEGLSRRQLLRQGATLGLGYAAIGSAREWGLAAPHARTLAYVGTYSSPIDGGAGNGKGIYLYEVDDATGELSLLEQVAEMRNASWLALHPSRDFLYSVNEIADFDGKASGSVSAFAVDRTSGKLKLLSVTSSEGAGPAHLSVDASGKFVFVANYIGGTVAVLPVLPTGALGAAIFVHHDAGSLGSKVPVDAPAGSYAFSGHDKPHAHMIQADPSNRFVIQTDLAQDRIYVASLDAATGKLTPSTGTPFVTLPDGDGPRHFTFHANGRWMYSLQEEASTVVFFHFDPQSGSLTAQQTLSTLPPGFKGTSFTSEIVTSADGRFLYAANRLHDSIAIFSIGNDGRLAYLGETYTGGDYPRHIGLHPDGTFMYASNQRNDSVTAFRVDRKTGLLQPTGRYLGVGSPTCIVFLR